MGTLNLTSPVGDVQSTFTISGTIELNYSPISNSIDIFINDVLSHSAYLANDLQTGDEETGITYIANFTTQKTISQLGSKTIRLEFTNDDGSKLTATGSFNVVAPTPDPTPSPTPDPTPSPDPQPSEPETITRDRNPNLESAKENCNPKDYQLFTWLPAYTIYTSQTALRINFDNLRTDATYTITARLVSPANAYFGGSPADTYAVLDNAPLLTDSQYTAETPNKGSLYVKVTAPAANYYDETKAIDFIIEIFKNGVKIRQIDDTLVAHPKELKVSETPSPTPTPSTGNPPNQSGTVGSGGSFSLNLGTSSTSPVKPTPKITRQPANGTVSIGATGEAVYTPNSGFTGTDSYGYGYDYPDGTSSGSGDITIEVPAPSPSPDPVPTPTPTPTPTPSPTSETCKDLADNMTELLNTLKKIVAAQRAMENFLNKQLGFTPGSGGLPVTPGSGAKAGSEEINGAIRNFLKSPQGIALLGSVAIALPQLKPKGLEDEIRAWQQKERASAQAMRDQINAQNKRLEQLAKDGKLQGIGLNKPDPKLERELLQMKKEFTAYKFEFKKLSSQVLSFDLNGIKGQLKALDARFQQRLAGLADLIPHGKVLGDLAGKAGKILSMVAGPIDIISAIINQGTIDKLDKRMDDLENYRINNDNYIVKLLGMIGKNKNDIAAVQKEVLALKAFLSPQQIAAINGSLAALKIANATIQKQVTTLAGNVSKAFTRSEAATLATNVASAINTKVNSAASLLSKRLADVEAKLKALGITTSKTQQQQQNQAQAATVSAKDRKSIIDEALKAMSAPSLAQIQKAISDALKPLSSKVDAANSNAATASKNADTANKATSTLASQANKSFADIATAVKTGDLTTLTGIKDLQAKLDPIKLGSQMQSATDFSFKANLPNFIKEVDRIENLYTQKVLDKLGKPLELSTASESKLIKQVNDLLDRASEGIKLNTGKNVSNLNQGLTALNANDQVLKAALESLGRNAVSQQSLANTESNLGNALSALNTSLSSSVNANFAQVNKSLQVQTNGIVQISNAVTQTNNSVMSINPQLLDLRNGVGTVGFKADQLISSIGATNTKIDAIPATLAPLNTGISSIANSLSTVNSSISGLNTGVNTLNTGVTQANQSAQQAKQAADATGSKVDNLGSKLDAIPDKTVQGINGLNLPNVTANTVLAGMGAALATGLGAYFLRNKVKAEGMEQVQETLGTAYKANGKTVPIVQMLGQPVLNTAGKPISLMSRLSTVAQQTGLSAAMNVWNTAMTFHNAIMLSVDFKESGVLIIQNVVEIFRNALGMKDPDDEVIDFNAIINTNFEAIMDRIFGASNWESIKMKLTALNRIYQAATNSFSALQEMWEVSSEAVRYVSENVSKIGNGLRKSRVVPENEYGIMDETFADRVIVGGKLEKFNQRVTNKLGGIENVMSGLVAITSNVLEMQNAADDLAESLTELRVAHGDALAKVAEAEAEAKAGTRLPDSFAAEPDFRSPPLEETDFTTTPEEGTAP